MVVDFRIYPTESYTLFWSLKVYDVAKSSKLFKRNENKIYNKTMLNYVLWKSSWME